MCKGCMQLEQSKEYSSRHNQSTPGGGGIVTVKKYRLKVE